LTDHHYILNQITYKGKPAERQGRKALGLKQNHGRPAAMYNLLLSWQFFNFTYIFSSHDFQLTYTIFAGKKVSKNQFCQLFQKQVNYRQLHSIFSARF